MTKKNAAFQILLLLFLTCGTAFSQTLALKANIGVCACWDAVGLNVYEICGLKVGTLSMILHILCVLVQLAIQRREFSGEEDISDTICGCVRNVFEFLLL